MAEKGKRERMMGKRGKGNGKKTKRRKKVKSEGKKRTREGKKGTRDGERVRDTWGGQNVILEGVGTKKRERLLYLRSAVLQIFFPVFQSYRKTCIFICIW